MPGQEKQHFVNFIISYYYFISTQMDRSDTQQGCDLQFVNTCTSQDTHFVNMEESSSKDAQVVNSYLSIPK